MIRIIFFSFLIAIFACSPTVKEQMQPTSYHEKHRLQFHFSPEAKWMNDPNGLVFHQGEYHMFYQHYPDSTVWGPMHWGHAVSKDLVHWEHLPIALYPDSLGYIFSGSAVLDKKNTSGLGTTSNPPLVAIFTYHHPEMEREGSNVFQTQAIAYSLDNGRTWTKYNGNPVLPNPGIKDFRDPKVFWYEPQQKWVMALAVKDHISFYSSPDLKNWKLESEFGVELGAHGGVWECPDLFKLKDKWILLVSINPGGPNGGSATQYFAGDFDGTTFTPADKLTRWLDYGRDNYAGVTWSDIPEADSRRIFIGWMSNWDYSNVVPTEKWRSAMTVPRALDLVETNNGPVVTTYPVAEIRQLRSDSIVLNKTNNKEVDINPNAYAIYDLELHIDSKTSVSAFEIELSNESGEKFIIAYNPDKGEFILNRDKSGKNDFSDKFNGLQSGEFPFKESVMNIRMLVDVGSVELFVNEGTLSMTGLFFSEQPLTKAIWQSQSSAEMKTSGMIYKMQSIWN